MAKKTEVLQFEPSLPQDRSISMDQCRSRISALTAIFPETGVRAVWDFCTPVPDYILGVDIRTSLSDEQKVVSLILSRKSVSPEILDAVLEDDLVEYINTVTTKQAGCSLWHQLRRGRVTSSNFGAIHKSINSPSLTRLILDNR